MTTTSTKKKAAPKAAKKAPVAKKVTPVKREARFITTPYVRAHGHEPKGQGTWAFQQAERYTAFDSDRKGPVVTVTGTLAKAKKEAAKQIGPVLIAVLS